VPLLQREESSAEQIAFELRFEEKGEFSRSINERAFLRVARCVRTLGSWKLGQNVYMELLIIH
jgi:hypothetical protein